MLYNQLTTNNGQHANIKKMKSIRIAVVISNSPVGKIRQNLDALAGRVKEAKKKNAAIICFPEMNITGYSTRKKIVDSAQFVPDSVTGELAELAEKENITILAGLAEKDKKGRIFAGHLVVTPQGLSGVYRKLHIAPPEQRIFSPGKNIPLFETHGVRFGIQLCYDAHFPELSTRMAIEGADLIFIPHASPRGTPDEKFSSWMRHLTARAYDNGLFIVACNQTGENKKGLNFPGIALVIDPSGNVIAKDVSGKENMIVVHLKAGDLAKVRNHKMRFFLPNRRPDLLDLTTSINPQRK
ncbi:MAG: nitrilase-related carbon-nitrogen hydrolase [Desulfobacterales bacterium]|nr:nitrilase-related carbon-nitrogen hydrolase [Desulfobacterales bacterium]MDX2508343.1 nitrilase-related carbon-nitrogen hydrolase [Desulfobacterales bacterium]